MKIIFHRDFKKEYKKLGKNIRVHFQEQLVIFENNPFDPQLNNHPLKGKQNGLRSINITGDLRAVYEMVDDDFAHFIALGSHSNLYK